jgi:hypothetical protein
MVKVTVGNEEKIPAIFEGTYLGKLETTKNINNG